MLTNTQRGTTLPMEVGRHLCAHMNAGVQGFEKGSVLKVYRPNLTFFLLNESRHNAHISCTHRTF